MTEAIGISIGAAGLIITILGGLLTLAFKMGTLSSRVAENTKDIEKIQNVYVTGLKDVNDKLDRVLASVNDICQRVSNLEGRINGERGK